MKCSLYLDPFAMDRDTPNWVVRGGSWASTAEEALATSRAPSSIMRGDLDRLGIGREKIKFRSDKIGYCGGAATLLHLDEMVRTGEIKPGQLAIVHAVESSKWMTAGFAVRW